jgi:protein phosphatase
MALPRHAGLSDIGHVRADNQDRWAADPALGLYVVADGMGGAAAGALAAQVVVETLPPLLRQRLHGVADLGAPVAADCLAGALAELSERVRAGSHGRPDLDGMGSTVVLALVRGTEALVAHLGDSRAYLLRDGRLELLTRDHSLAQLLVDCGEIAPEDAGLHPGRAQLTRYVGMPGEALPEVTSLSLRPGDRLLLCSDGLTTMLDDNLIRTILASRAGPDETCRRLVASANAAGGRDNITALVVDAAGPGG